MRSRLAFVVEAEPIALEAVDTPRLLRRFRLYAAESGVKADLVESIQGLLLGSSALLALTPSQLREYLINDIYKASMHAVYARCASVRVRAVN